jgi:hypothetical protein
MAGPLADYIVTNPTANTWYIAPNGYGIVPATSSTNTYECRSFNSVGVQTVYGKLAAGAHDVTTSADSRSGLTGTNQFGVTWNSTLGNNNTDTVVPQGEINTTLSGGNYIAIRVNSYTGRQALQVKVRRSGAWAYATAVKLRRSSAWNTASNIKVRRSSAWTIVG